MPDQEVKFCWCGMPLIKALNKKFNGTREGYCDEKCENRYKRDHRQKNRPKYGIAGYIYG